LSVNQNIPKVDGLGLITGKPAYTDDLAPKDALIVKVLRSPYAYAKIKCINTEKALKVKGISLILTHKNVPDAVYTRAGQGSPEPSPYDKKILDEYVRYIGDEVAVVAGINATVVDEAIKNIKVEYEVLEPVLDYEKAIGHQSKVHDPDHGKVMLDIGRDASKNIAASYGMEINNVEEEFEKSDYYYEDVYYTQAQAHTMSEPHSAYAYLDLQDRLNIVTSTQTPFHVRRIVGKTLDIPLSKIRVFKPRIGGGYGGKQFIHGEFFVSLVTLQTKKPCKLIYTRKEVFEATNTRHPMRIKMRIGAMADGMMNAIEMKILSNTGAYGEHSLTVLMVAGSKTLPLYNKVKAVKFSGDVVYTNTTPAGAFRGYGAVQGNFALESAVTEMANIIGMDPIEFRRLNMIKENETSKIFEVMGEGTEGTAQMIESCKLEACTKVVKEKIQWDKKYPFVDVDNKTVRSVGFAIAMQGSGIPYIDMGSAVLKLNDDGFFNLQVGATDLGTGSDTVLAQIAAEVLEVPTDKIIVYSSDTDQTPYDVGAYASSTTYVSGNSVYLTAKDMLDTLKERAKQVLKVDEISYKSGVFTSGDQSITLVDLSNELFYGEDMKQLVVSESYYGKKSPPPYMACACEVEINKETGVLKVLECVASVDCGVTLNPNLAKIHVEGALVQGLGMALTEQAKRGPKGQLYNNSFLNYGSPTKMDFGKLDVSFVDSYEPSGPFGAKSVGEIGIDTLPAIISNAIKNAIGKRMKELPMTPEKIWRAMYK
jgi:putative selenate reductase molybdopterin-binding subunit